MGRERGGSLVDISAKNKFLRLPLTEAKQIGTEPTHQFLKLTVF